MKQTTLQTDIINGKTETEKTDRQSETDYTTNRYNKQEDRDREDRQAE